MRVTGVREAVLRVSGLAERELLVPILASMEKAGLLGIGLVHGRLLEVWLLDSMESMLGKMLLRECRLLHTGLVVWRLM